MPTITRSRSPDSVLSEQAREAGQWQHRGKTMRSRATVWVFSIAFTLACSGQKLVESEPLPQWVTELIQELESQPVANPPAYIARYDYKGQVVYYLPPRCCDIPSVLFSAEGGLLTAQLNA